MDDLRIETTSAGTNGNLLMFRDSFGNTLHSLLAESFGHAVFSRATPYDLGAMDTIQADTVILEIVERNLKNLAEYPFVLPAPQTDLTLASWGADREEAAIAVQAVENPQFPGYLTVTGTCPAATMTPPSAWWWATRPTRPPLWAAGAPRRGITPLPPTCPQART